jgi:transposase InsO family protein
MPWMEASAVYLREEFLALARQPDSNVAALCRRFGISRKTAYKWLRRCGPVGDAVSAPAVLVDRSRRPRSSPALTDASMQQQVCQLRERHRAWGGRKIHARLLALGQGGVPAPSTISDILRRHGLLDAQRSASHKPFIRFEHPAPNDLWQMDFIGHFATDAGRCHPLTVLDDHSRFCLGVRACENQTGKLVQKHLSSLFSTYGLPRRILCDNGSPWGASRTPESSADGDEDAVMHRHTWLSVWLMRLGVGVGHGRPYHPQTQGKDERFNRTVKAEAIGARRFIDNPDVQRYLDPWRDVYNLQRPHEALGMRPPATRYQPSTRDFPAKLPAIEYAPGDIVRMVRKDGYLKYKAKTYKISQAFAGCPIALRPTSIDGLLEVFFCHAKVGAIDLKRQNVN